MLATPEPEAFAEALEDDGRLEHLRQANARLSHQLIEARAAKAELIDAVYRAARDAAAAFSPALPGDPAPDRRRRGEEWAIAVLADWQLAKVTPSYNSAVCRERVRRYAQKVRTLTGIQRADHPVRNLKVYLLGDLIEGEQIFPGQAHRIDASLFRQVMVDGPEILGGFLLDMLRVFERVEVEGVIGNHGAIGGRGRRETHPETNGDAMLYEVTRIRLEKQQRLVWGPNMVPGERKWHAVDRVGQHGFLLFHGDQVKGGFAGYPWYGFGKKLQGWRINGVKEPFDYALSGHFHTPARLYVNGLTLWGSGSTESDNTYAAESLAAAGEPCQWLLFAEPERGVTAEYLVHLNESA